MLLKKVFSLITSLNMSICGRIRLLIQKGEIGMSERKVLIIAYQNSIIVRGIEKRLTDQKCTVATIGPEMHSIKVAMRGDPVILVYLAGNVSEDIEKLQEFVSECDIDSKDLIIIGEKKDKLGIIRAVPLISQKTWIDRPINMDLLADIVKGIMRDREDREKKHNILIVDDDPSFAKMAREWLKYDYHVDIVTAGVQAITFLAKTPVDLILLDYEMPVVDGPQVLHMIRSEEAIANIPVVFLTGIGTRESVQRVMSLKPEGYILKSTTRPELLKNLKSIFENLNNRNET